jgi:hypothetical protein
VVEPLRMTKLPGLHVVFTSYDRKQLLRLAGANAAQFDTYFINSIVLSYTLV